MILRVEIPQGILIVRLFKARLVIADLMLFFRDRVLYLKLMPY